MMKHKMMTCLAVTAIATAALGIPAFAAEAKQKSENRLRYKAIQ